MIDSVTLNQLLSLAIEIQQIPAPTFSEDKRGKFIVQKFINEGLVDTLIDQIGNVYARFPGTNNSRPIVLTAHMDTVFPLETDLHINQTKDRIAGPGIGDNSLGVAGLIGLVWLLKQGYKLSNDLWLVGNVCEEGLGDLRGMKAVVDRFGGKPKAYLILEGMALGSIYHRGLSVRRYRIQAAGKGGHSWVNFGRPSAIHEMARFINRLEELRPSVSPKASYNVGTIRGGTSVNTIAAEAEIELDLRSEDGTVLLELARKVEKFVIDANRLGDDLVKFQFEIIGNRPTGEIPAKHPLVKLASAVLEKQGISPHLEIGSTDANIPLSKGYPAVCIGITNGSGAHTQDEYIETQNIQKGITQLLDLVITLDKNM